jgi:hypothetical protein
VETAKEQNRYDTAAMSRIYVLNRYVFAVPRRRPLGSRRFGSFMGIPHDERSVDEWWPLARDARGRWKLTGRFEGYAGEDYQALEEFDYFRREFGPRKKEGS